MRPLAAIYRRFLKLIAARLPRDRFLALVNGLITAYSATHPPDEALRAALELDNRLYGHIGRLAIRYGGGVHPKHRHTRYHEFFTDRVSEGERVLDVGCGIGAVAYELAEKSGASVTGIDVNPDAIDLARERFPHRNVRYVLCDVTKELPDGHFDVIVMSNVLEHLDDRIGILHHLAVSATPSRFLIRVPLYERDWRVPLKDELGVDYRLDPTHKVEYTIDGFEREMAEAGLETIERIVKWGEIWAVAVPRQR